MKKVYFKTFGCRTNQFDTQIMINNLSHYTVVDNEDEADIIVINSCTVTNGADSGVRNYVHKCERLNKQIFLTGCGALTQGEKLFEQGKIHSVFGHSEKQHIQQFLTTPLRQFVLGDLTHIDASIVPEFIGKSRAFIKIQEGCNFECSYCIIPSVRGLARSLNEQMILEQIRLLASNGFGEFILTGTNVGSYGHDTLSSLASLLKKISLIRGVRRIRIGSLEPSQITDEFKELLKEPWMAKHLHIALQHAHDTLLYAMNRRNRVQTDLTLLEEIAHCGYAIGTDFIVGFPGETEEIWEQTLQHIHQYPLTHIHPFIFSPRNGTPAATLKERIHGDISKKRLNELQTIIKNHNLQFRLLHDHDPLNILVESSLKEGLYSGYDQYYNKMIIDSQTPLQGEWIQISRYDREKEYNVTSF